LGVSAVRAAKRRREPSEEVPFIPPELKGVNKRVEQARELAGLQVSEAGTSRWERGLRLKKASAVEFVRLAKKLGVRVGWLICGELPMRDGGRGPNDPAPIRAEELEE
jgi:hypothetical protein